MVPEPTSDVERAEAAVAANLEPLLWFFRPAFDAAEMTLRREAEDLDTRRSSSAVFDVQGALIARLADDLRAVFLLCGKGLRLQAIALAASLLETSLTIGRIGESESDASLWRSWTNPRKTPWRWNEMIDPTVGRIDVANRSKLKKAFETWYRAFCMAKHNNGRLLTMGNRRVSPVAIVIASLREVSPGEVGALAVVMESSLQIALYGLLAFCGSDLTTLNDRSALTADDWQERLSTINTRLYE